MTERKWREGPWVSADKGYGDLRVVDSYGYEVAEISTAEASADAYLIAAAPDLYEALEIIRGQYCLFVGPDDDISDAVLSEVDAALSKARGETNV